jgi:hypothetical protein
VLLSTTATQGNSDVQAVLRDQLHRFASQRVDLSLTTQSGARIELHLAANADGIAVDFKLAQGTLDDDDRAAMSALGDAFEQALQGLAAQPPTLALDGLMHLDQQHLAAIDLNATLGDALQVQLHADASQRSVTATSAAGTMKVAVDATSETLAGSAQQRQRAIASYLQQFDAATRRGHGDAALSDLFKDAFAQLHGGSTTPTRPGDQLAPALVADLNDRRMLSGLADFTASITGASVAPNPLRRDEVDGFDYQVSQHTSLSGARQADRSIVQQAQARLKASYHQSLQADLPLRLGTDRQSQNYTYHQIDDQADSRLEIGYRLGYMTQARLQQSASQDSRVSKYVLGQLVSQSHTPCRPRSCATLPPSCRTARRPVSQMGPTGAASCSTASVRWVCCRPIRPGPSKRYAVAQRLNGAQGRRVRRYVSPSTLLRRPPQQLVYRQPSSFKIRASLWGVASFRVIRKSPCQHSRQHLPWRG